MGINLFLCPTPTLLGVTLIHLKEGKRVKFLLGQRVFLIDHNNYVRTRVQNDGSIVCHRFRVLDRDLEASVEVSDR
jgi:hypothetical protein